MTTAELRNIPFIEKSLRLIPDSIYLRLLYKRNVGVWPNLSSPKSFTEKIQWLKLHDRRPEYRIMVDKLLVKDYVANIIGKEYIIPTLAVWDDVNEIDVSSLPDQFVLKWNHDSGSIIICKDKYHFNIETAISRLSTGQRKNGFWYGREWPYKTVTPLIIAERFMSSNNESESDLADYKFFCFNGIPHLCQVIRNRSTNETIDFYDMEWNHLPFIGIVPLTKLQTLHNGTTPVDKPSQLSTMINICSKLSKNIPFCRVDLYLINETVYFGEITFYPASGFGLFYPNEWDNRLGNLLNIDWKNNKII